MAEGLCTSARHRGASVVIGRCHLHGAEPEADEFAHGVLGMLYAARADRVVHGLGLLCLASLAFSNGSMGRLSNFGKADI